VICHFLDAPKTKIGRSKDCQINLNGLSIISEHAIITNNKGQVKIEPAEIGAKIKVNGTGIESAHALEHNDRILFGSSHLYIFVDPKKQVNKEQQVSWETAQKELAEARGFKLKNTSLSKGKFINYLFLMIFEFNLKFI
jgi:pSer/pThr/pTyr-binding forkhead associated (FHA) protein